MPWARKAEAIITMSRLDVQLFTWPMPVAPNLLSLQPPQTEDSTLAMNRLLSRFFFALGGAEHEAMVKGYLC